MAWIVLLLARYNNLLTHYLLLDQVFILVGSLRVKSLSMHIPVHSNFFLPVLLLEIDFIYPANKFIKEISDAFIKHTKSCLFRLLLNELLASRVEFIIMMLPICAGIRDSRLPPIYSRSLLQGSKQRDKNR